jgi:uncharacterized repeat protein (TIGR03803 family)
MSIELTALLIIFTAMLLAASTHAVAQETILYNFTGGPEGGLPLAGLIWDASGNLYGTTAGDRTNDNGTVFELTPQNGGGWTENVLHEFSRHGKGGALPHAGLIFDDAGNLYGTTEDGGHGGIGTAFKLSPGGGGGWTETVLHVFHESGKDGNYLFGGLISDSQGNFYGTTDDVDDQYGGNVFELSPKAGGGWKETVLHRFGRYNQCHCGTDGLSPGAGLVRDAAGNLYGTTTRGGTFGWGTVFELSPKAGGGWNEAVLHSFNDVGTDGFFPVAGLLIDAAGNLYGTTTGGGANGGGGTVFELTPQSGGNWTETVLHSFAGGPNDGADPAAGLIFDAAGNLYGTTFMGGSDTSGCQSDGCGTVFELTPQSGGNWTETVLHSFSDDGTDGTSPYASLLLDAEGNLYGTTAAGGAQGYGTVFEVTP